MIDSAIQENAKRPIYLKLADDLRSQIVDGKLADIRQLPTENVLCNQYGVSRGTLREALRILINEGLIKRRQGSGTVVKPAIDRAGALYQPLSNVDEILQYADDTLIDFERTGLDTLPKDIADQLSIETATQWLVFQGIRRVANKERPIAFTKAWVNPEFVEAVEQLRDVGSTIFVQLAEFAELKVSRITQDIQAVLASQGVASYLDIDEDDVVLQIVRYYYDNTERLFEISVSYHPGDRFVYSMHIEANH